MRIVMVFKPLYTEPELVSMIKDKSKNSFECLYECYAPLLYGFIHKVLPDKQIAPSILQETFTKIWKDIDDYDPENTRLFTWMFNIALNQVAVHLPNKEETLRLVKQGIDSHKNIAQGTLILYLTYFASYARHDASHSLNIPFKVARTGLHKTIQLLKRQFNN